MSGMGLGLYLFRRGLIFGRTFFLLVFIWSIGIYFR